MKKRLLSILLVMTMILGMFPTTAFAADPAPIELGTATQVIDGSTRRYQYHSAAVTGDGYRTLIVEADKGKIVLPSSGVGAELVPAAGSSDTLKYVKFPDTADASAIAAYIQGIEFQVNGIEDANVTISLSETALDDVSLVYDNGVQHFYRHVAQENVSNWANAQSAAQASKLFNTAGHLATLPTEAQVNGAAAIMAAKATAWLGGHYAGTGAGDSTYSNTTTYASQGWYWVEDTTGTQFWAGEPARDTSDSSKYATRSGTGGQAGYGTSISGMPHYWKLLGGIRVEPNNTNSSLSATVTEDAITMQIGANGVVEWNDISSTTESVMAYLVEYDLGAITTPTSLGDGAVQATGTLTYSAPATYTVTYVLDGSQYGTPVSVQEGDTIKFAPYVESRDGYTFDGWYVNVDYTTKFVFASAATAENPATTVTSDLTLYAKLTAVSKVTITYDDGLTEVVATNMPTGGDVLPNTNYTIPEVIPAANGYTFKGWKIGDGDTVYQPGHNFKPTADTTITAQWTEIPGEVTITYTAGTDVTGVTVPDNVTITEGDSYTISNMVPVREGYVFNGWSVVIGTATAEVKQPGAAITASANVTLTAQWTEDKVTITWPTTITGVTVDGITGKNTVTRGSTVTFWLKLEAGYDPSTLTVTANDVPLSYVKAVMETTVGATTSTETRYYYTFTAAEDTTVEVSAPSKYTYIVTLPTGDHFTAKFDSKDELAESVTYGGNSTQFTVTAAEGWKINGVYANGTKLTATGGKYQVTNVTANTTVTVDMTEIVFRTVTYVLDGKQMATQSVTSGVDFTLLKAPVPAGYTWDSKWYTDEGYATEYTANNTDEDLILYGKLDANKYTISYDGNVPTGAGTAENIPTAATTKTYGQAVQLSTNVPTLTGYTFKGWALESNKNVAVYQPGDTFSAEITSYITLYAVWEKNTYTVTINAGQGCTVHYYQDNLNVEHGTHFSFGVIVDSEYQQFEPDIWVHETGSDVGHSDWVQLAGTYPIATNGTNLIYRYVTTAPVTTDLTINVDIARNEKHTVTFKYAGLETGHDLTNATYMTQQVEWNQKATQPAAPTVEGYTFEGWYTSNTDFSDANKFSFDTAIKDDTMVYAHMVPVVPEVSWTNVDNDGWTITVTNATLVSSDTELNVSPNKVKYGSDMTFTITVEAGWDASKMQVAANGAALAATAITTNTDGSVTYTYLLSNITANTAITVAGVVRKTITITYNPNARDDVSGMPVQQVVNYYVADATDNSTIVNQTPVRTGYTFKGWSKTSTDAVGTHQPGETANFTTDTTLYAIWEASELTVDLTFGGAFNSAASATSPSTTVPVPSDTNKGILDYFYEGDEIVLVATLSAAAQGTVTFYKLPYNEYDAATPASNHWVPVTNGTVATNGGKVVSVSTTVEPYEWSTAGGEAKNSNYRWLYKAVFDPTVDEGYTSCSDQDDIRVYSKAISWALSSGGRNNDPWTINTNADVLKIYPDDNGTKGTNALNDSETMKANTVYWLEIPTVIELDGGLTLKNGSVAKNPTVGSDYQVLWQIKDAKNSWQTVYTTNTTDVKIEAKYSQYSFRALVQPVSTGIYTKAAKIESGTVVKDVYEDYLYTQPTKAVDRKDTTTDLVILGADTEDADVVINGADDVFTDAHLAQFEGQPITLKATVKETDTTNKVTDGGVYFYRWDGTTATQLNDTLIEVDANGVAELPNVVVKAYITEDGKTAIDNVDQFYAVYQTHETWNTSDSRGTDSSAYQYADVYVKSTSIKTPVIESAKAGKVDGVTGDATTYEKDLTDLLAGVEHKFTLRQTHGTDTPAADWSVVALDGRTVDADNYSIQWLVKTGTNEEQAANEATQATFIVEDSKVGDMYRVKLSAKGDMKVDAYSKYVKIGTKQDVNVTVTASDEIASTTETDVYQLNEITLTATVAAKETNATMKPTGTVTFYYSVDNGTTWVKVGETTDLAEVAGVVTASIKTTALPVKASDNTKQDVKISALYSGDKTFNAIENQDDSKITQEEVTVYSSVVFVTNIENTTNAGSTKANGIYITVTEGSLLNNEDSVTLKLSDIYTLDYNDTLAETVAKLKLGTDYTVQWQELENAAAFAGDYAGAANWQDITGKTGNTCEFSVKQGAAYRAVITVKDTPIAKGSFTEVDQGTVGTEDIKDGRKVYYSNILVAAKAPSTLTVNVNTSNTADGYEGIVQGETVTVHTFTSGATGTTPISELTVTIQKDGATEPEPGFPKTKTNVNGHVSFDWVAAEPGYYTLTLNAKYTNGYSDKTITRTLIVRDNNYSFTVSGDNTTYNGKAQGLNVTVDNMGIESALADDSVVVYYYTDAARTQQVEPTQAGTYYVTIRLQESAYWTEQTMTKTKDDPEKDLTFTIKRREVQVVDLVAQAKVYDGTTNANILEIILNDAETDQTTTGLPTGTTGIINGDSVYATGVMTIGNAGAGSQTLSVSDVVLHGDDAHNYKVGTTSYTETINVQRSQVKGYIVEGTVFKYTGSNITVPADQIYLIDQAGNKLTANDYTVTYYYHNGDGVEKVTAMNKMGKYTVIARPEQTNYKGGASATVYVGETAQNGTADTTPTSALIDITNTVELYGAAGNQGIVATATTGTISKIEYYVGSGSTTTDVPTAAGRYLVKVTASTGDTAYGIYTVVKANPVLTLTATDAEYTSAQIVGVSGGTYNGGAFPAGTYYSYTGGTIQGVSYTAPTEVGTYVVTAHVPETENYTAHEVSATFTITPKALKITADSLQRHQYGAYPDLTASFEGLASSTYAPDTSLRDVQIQPELVFATGYTNSASDQVGNEYAVKPVAALARNYKITYEDGNVSVTEVDANPELAIHGMIDNGNGVNIAYYGDVIQLYPYGSQKGDVINNSSILKWSVSDTSVASIDENGLLKILKPGMFTVTLTRGEGTQQIKTELAISAWRKEVTIDVEDQDKVYSGTEQTYNGTVTVNGLINGDTVTPECKGGNKRTDVGSQITTYQLDPATVGTLYVSEIYGGLFTINDKDVTVKPGAQETVYGTKEAYEATKYTVEGEVNSVAALTNSQVASIADAYGNLDVLDGYEILVTGTENKNYNVKYQTKQTGKDVGDVNVTPLALTVTTGTLNDQVGMTSGSLNPVGKYPVNGAVVDSSETLGTTNVRMYGEPNWVMDYALATLIAGDSMADLVGLSNWLVGFNYNIGGNASVIYTDKSTAIDQSQYDTTKYTIPAKDDQKIWTNTTGKHVAQINVENYTENLNLGTQYIYQRPVELKCTVSDAHKELARSTSKEDLQSILIQNITADKLGGVGGLATLLKHTVADLDLKITYQGYNGTTWVDITGDFANLAGYTKIKATIKVGNPNYYAESLTVEFTVRAARYIIEINPFAAQYAVAKLYLYDEDTSAKTLTWFDEDVSLAAGATSNVMRCKIYQNIGSNKYADYAYETPIVNAMMKKGSTVGEYTISYNTLTCHAQMFAIADGYIIIDNP